jgi:ribA/ribD-fused uncharacterized protein
VQKITSFFGDYRFLSNFYPAQILMDGEWYETVEHAYQAAKTLDPRERDVIRAADTPGRAKRLARHITLRHNWEAIKLTVMEDLVRQKFLRYVHLRRRLLATGDAELIEGNVWGDEFWGVCDGEGENHLGRILMKVRSELR